MKRVKYISNGTITYKIVGEQGPQGPKGEVGPQGPQGPQGDAAPVEIVREEIDKAINDGKISTYDDTEIKNQIGSKKSVKPELVKADNGIVASTGASQSNLNFDEVKYVFPKTGEYSELMYPGVKDSWWGYAFFDNAGTLIKSCRSYVDADWKMERIRIPDNAKTFKFQVAKGKVDETELLLIKDFSSSSDIFYELNLSEKRNQNNDIYMQPLGIMDNILIDKLDGCGYHQNIYFKSYEKDRFTYDSNGNITTFNFDYTQPVSQNKYHINGFIRVKITSPKFHLMCTFASGSNVDVYANTPSGATLYKRNSTTEVLGRVVENDGEYILVYLRDPNNKSVTFKALTEYGNNESNKGILEIDRNHSAFFHEQVQLTDAECYKRYYSRSEKLGSRLRGKNAILFADSQSNISFALENSYGMNIYLIANGGNRMGFVDATGAGGETGDANSMFLCKSEIVKNFNDKMLGGNINIDYIMNFTGTNGDFETYGTKSDLDYVLNPANKRWWGDTSATDPFDSLSAENKQKFTSPLCYIASFIKLQQIFPEANPVCIGIYNTPRYSKTDSCDSNGKWVESKLSQKFYDNAEITDTRKRNDLIKEIAHKLGCLFVNSDDCGYSIVNAFVASADGVHATFKYAERMAYTIAQKLNYPTFSHEDYPAE